MKEKIIFLVGPTGITKTKTAALLARKLNGEIISCDSMQVYKGMDILTSKPSLALRRKVTHHLIDIISPQKEYNVSRYRRDALRKIREVLNKKKIPLVVGGTGLYMSILIDGIFKAKSQNKEIRLRLYKEAEGFGKEYLYKRLKSIDPEAALRIHPNDIKRIVRALEVFETMGRPISALQAERKGLTKEYDVRIYCLGMERQGLYEKINKRVDKMFRQGLVKEVRKLLKLKLSKTSRFAIGIREIKDYLEGMYDLEQAKELIKRNTRWYAKRQLTWFRKDKRIHWVQIGQGEKPESAARKIMKVLSANSVI